jgi:AcrR family transcriptional regulator
VDNGYPRGEETRARIIDAAVELFGESGFGGTSTRDIAARAGVNAPVLQYYFDSKEGLYLACMQQVIAGFWRFMGTVTERAESALARGASDPELIEAFCQIQMQWAEVASSDQSRNWRRLLERQHADIGPAFALDVYYEGITRRMFAITVAIVARLLNTSVENPETQIRALAVGGQLAILHSMPRTTLVTLKRDRIGEKELALFKSVVREHTTVVLRSFARARSTQPSINTR